MKKKKSSTFNVMNYPRIFQWVMNHWPPYWGAGVRVESIRPDWREITVSLTLRWYNRNYVNSHFGGSLFAMTDPFYMLMLIRNLGKEYVVWDMAASITFLKPGRGKVTARFSIDDSTVSEIHAKLAVRSKHLARFPVEIIDSAGEIIARVDKTVYIRKKNDERA